MEHNDRWIVVKFDEIEKRLDQAFKLRDKAIDASKEELRDRLEKMNEIREQLDRQAATFVGREWVDGRFNGIDRQLLTLDKAVAGLENRANLIAETNLKRLLVAGLIIGAIQVLTILFVWAQGS